MFSKAELAVIFVLVIGALSAALYKSWMQQIEVVLALLVVVVVAIAVTVFR